MAFFQGYIGAGIFALCVGTVLAIAVTLILTIFVIPYALWIGVQNTKGKHKDKKDEQFFQSVRNATKLYKAWITHKEPTF